LKSSAKFWVHPSGVGGTAACALVAPPTGAIAASTAAATVARAVAAAARTRLVVGRRSLFGR